MRIVHRPDVVSGLQIHAVPQLGTLKEGVSPWVAMAGGWTSADAWLLIGSLGYIWASSQNHLYQPILGGSTCNSGWGEVFASLMHPPACQELEKGVGHVIEARPLGRS